jgi:SAM-dependent methyltransferase
VDRLNLGAGNDIIAGALNHDRVKHRPEIAVAHDLNVLPWPWEDDSFDVIVAKTVLEHLRINLVVSLDECWRLLRPEGLIYLKLPYWQAERSYDDPTHLWRFTLRSLNYFDPETPEGASYGMYTDRKWKLMRAPALNGAGTSLHVTMQVRK